MMKEMDIKIIVHQWYVNAIAIAYSTNYVVSYNMIYITKTLSSLL